jgi:PST family polysaccharide transporter
MNTTPVDGTHNPPKTLGSERAEGETKNDNASSVGPRAGEDNAERVKGARKGWMTRIGGLIRNDLVHNTAALYGVQLCRKIFPLITMPYLARVLGPSVWGTVAFVSSLGEFIVLMIEFGFNLSATRQIAQARNSPEICGNVMAGVVGAQALLATASITAAWLASRFIPLLRDNPHLLWAGVFYGVCQGLNPLWFFQGLERLRLLATLEIVGKTIGVIGVFLVVRSPENAWLALLLQGIPPMLSAIIGMTIAYRQFPFVVPTISLVRDALVSSWKLFVFRSGESLYGAGNAFILGLFAPIASVGYFAIAEKISKAAFGLLNPIREALYPRLSRLAAGSGVEMARLARIGAALMISGGFLLGIVLYAFAPFLIRTITGSNFSPAVTVLRIFALLPPLLSVTYSVGLQWLLPHGQDGVVNRIILTAGALNILMAFAAAPRFQHVGMAVSVLLAECFVCASMVHAVMVRTPFWNRRTRQETMPSPLGKEVFNG